MTFQCVLVIQSSLSLYPKLIDTKNTVLTKLTIVPKSARRTSPYADIVWFCVKLWDTWGKGLQFILFWWKHANFVSWQACEPIKVKPKPSRIQWRTSSYAVFGQKCTAYELVRRFWSKVHGVRARTPCTSSYAVMFWLDKCFYVPFQYFFDNGSYISQYR